jgi:hypothetical protein
MSTQCQKARKSTVLAITTLSTLALLLGACGAAAPADQFGPSRSGPNYALAASANASSENVGTTQTARKAIDGIVDGYPSDYTKEWATVGQGAGAWLRVSWGMPLLINQVVLYDRPNLSDQVTAGVLSFSDGTTVAVGVLNNDGSETPVVFPQRTVTTITFQVSAVSAKTSNVGLAELEVYGP